MLAVPASGFRAAARLVRGETAVGGVQDGRPSKIVEECRILLRKEIMQKTTIASDIELAEAKAGYDSACKRILSNRVILVILCRSAGSIMDAD